MRGWLVRENRKLRREERGGGEEDVLCLLIGWGEREEGRGGRRTAGLALPAEGHLVHGELLVRVVQHERAAGRALQDCVCTIKLACEEGGEWGEAYICS